MIEIDAKLYDEKSSQSKGVKVEFLDDKRVIIKGNDSFKELTFDSLKISSRVGNTHRVITSPNGEVLHSFDNDLIDRAIKLYSNRSQLAFKLESSYKFAIISIVAIVAVVALYLTVGLDISAKAVAKMTPYSIKETISKTTLTNLDKYILEDSNLSKEQKLRVTKIFKTLTNNSPKYKLHFRKGMGINAFALPDGEIVVLDELVKFCDKDDDMIFGVLAHERGHVDLDHSMQLIAKSSMVGVLIAYFTGDVSSSITGIVASVINAKFSREYESQADIFAKKLMLSHHKDPKHLADFFIKIEKKYHLDPSDVTSFFASHPSDKDRIKMLTSK